MSFGINRSKITSPPHNPCFGNGFPTQRDINKRMGDLSGKIGFNQAAGHVMSLAGPLPYHPELTKEDLAKATAFNAHLAYVQIQLLQEISAKLDKRG